MSLFIKICGVTDPREAVACGALGADAIGINFWPRSPRHAPLPAARLIAAALREEQPAVLLVGVFVNAAPAEIAAALLAGLIDVAQLHGDEGPEARAQLAGRLWKGLRLSGPEDLGRLALYPPGEWERLVIDAPCAGYGGSGRRIDTDLAALAAGRREVLLAGGLDPDNVSGAVLAVRPAGIDVASGVELSPGRKDLGRVAALITAARAARAAARHGPDPRKERDDP